MNWCHIPPVGADCTLQYELIRWVYNLYWIMNKWYKSCFHQSKFTSKVNALMVDGWVFGLTQFRVLTAVTFVMTVSSDSSFTPLSLLPYSFLLGLVGLVVNFLNDVPCVCQCGNGFPNISIGLLDLILEDLLIWILLLFVSFVFGFWFFRLLFGFRLLLFK